MDLLYAMCDREQAEDIVAELLSYLEKADYSIREELVGNYLLLYYKSNYTVIIDLHQVYL